MPQLVLIDHSLKRPGGHHFDYALSVLSAAEQAGYRPLLATNSRWRGALMLPQNWPVFPLFRHHTYSPYSVLSGQCAEPCNPFLSAGADTSPSASVIHRLRQAMRTWDQRRRVHRFTRACARLFQRIALSRGDHVFLPTISDFDLVALAQFLRSFPQGVQAHWHVQFHFNFLEGRESDYQRQSERLERMSQHFRQSLHGLLNFPLHYYATTEQLVEQYNRMRVVPFQLLNYPVNPAFLDLQARPLDERPLRVLCAGGLRAEKGAGELEVLLQQLEELDFAAGRLQLWVQAKRPSRIPVGRAQRVVLASLEQQPPAAARVVCVPHPLQPDQYARLLRSAHVGLFLYDSARYYTRCSGILVELLTAGVPVVVPGGCWLSEQLNHPAACGVGLIAANSDDVPRLLVEIAAHYDHYATSARQFAPRYFAMHDPARVIETLEQTAAGGCKTRDRAA